MYYLNCEHSKMDFAQFVGQLKAEADARIKGNDVKEKRDLAAKEKADAQNKEQLNNLRRVIGRLSRDRASSPSVPPAPAASSRPDLACFDRTELSRAVGELEGGVERLVAEGAENTIALNNARRWARDVFNLK